VYCKRGLKKLAYKVYMFFISYFIAFILMNKVHSDISIKFP